MSDPPELEIAGTIRALRRRQVAWWVACCACGVLSALATGFAWCIQDLGYGRNPAATCVLYAGPLVLLLLAGRAGVRSHAARLRRERMHRATACRKYLLEVLSQ